jgi:hypothetical protein
MSQIQMGCISVIYHMPIRRKFNYTTKRQVNTTARNSYSKHNAQEWQALFNVREDESEIRVRDGNRPIRLSLENQRANVHWGDELREKSDTVTRMYVLNVHGLSLDRRGGQFDELCRVTKEVQADVLCGQEINVDAAQPMVRNIMYQTSRQHWQRSRLIMGSTPNAFTTMYKPGGAMMMTTGNTTGRVLASETDPWGRWTSQTYRGLDQLKITIISAYQVGQDVPKKGVVTAATQQRSLILLANDPVSDPRIAFKRDLSDYLRTCKSRGDEVILVGDFNENMRNG